MNFWDQDVDTVLFDKDGTLIDFPSIWIPWVEDAVRYLRERIAGIDISPAEAKQAIGVDVTDGSVDPRSPLAIASIEESITILAFLLYQKGLSWDSAVIYARECIAYADKRQNDSTSLQAVERISDLLGEMKKRGMRLGVLTADDTDKARKQLEELQLGSYFDFVIGSDLVERGKPFPDMAYLARDRYGVDLQRAAMIGDTNADIQLGKRAGVKLTIGIASYTKGKTGHLQDADYKICNYGELFGKE
ncbi:HAD-superfamily hydrolase, subfamily ia, variant 3 [Bacillus sp. OxB-1]|uniref:HAD family hydrolase n=1 Tax=Bacillus sp. (strain OxB-1) TaxID=98228 RepID=UPI0005820EE9|nr:HAD family hydrolase [Bacillus sp. OxB-1]BAQ10234.1 HAD-superfamily hydrolase, subfamily ia, variant 3 [Bacillus sp. OxB-1]